MHLPQLITVPLAENLPHINKKFQKAKGNADYIDQQMDSANWPGMTGNSRFRTLALLSRDNFATILSVIKPKIYGKPVPSPDDLVRVAQEAVVSYRENFGVDAHHESLQVSLLTSAAFDDTADWRKIAKLYNDAPDDQKNLISGFFWEFRTLVLADLMDVGDSNLLVPEGLPAPDTKEVDGEVFVHCEIANDWVRDDVFYRQFRINSTAFGVLPDVVTYAGTLEQAVAKASAIALAKNGPVIDQNTGKPKVLVEDSAKRFTDIITIRLDSATDTTIVAEARLIRSVKPLPDATTVQDCKLEWGSSLTGTFTEQRFRKALYTTEKVFGVQWSKARHLDDALGL